MFSVVNELFVPLWSSSTRRHRSEPAVLRPPSWALWMRTGQAIRRLRS